VFEPRILIMWELKFARAAGLEPATPGLEDTLLRVRALFEARIGAFIVEFYRARLAEGRWFAVRGRKTRGSFARPMCHVGTQQPTDIGPQARWSDSIAFHGFAASTRS